MRYLTSIIQFMHNLILISRKKIIDFTFINAYLKTISKVLSSFFFVKTKFFIKINLELLNF